MELKENRIFIVDDDPVFTKMIEHKLKSNNFTNIQSFTNGYDCFSQLHQSPQIVILDHFLENEIGLNILKEIKDYDSEIIVVYVSSQDKASVVLKSIRYGAAEYLEKSITDLNTLADVVEKLRA